MDVTLMQAGQKLCRFVYDHAKHLLYPLGEGRFTKPLQTEVHEMLAHQVAEDVAKAEDFAKVSPPTP